MAAISPIRTSAQLRRLTQVEGLSLRGSFEEWVGRLDRRVVQDQLEAKVWREAPWNWSEVVGPIEAAQDVGDATRDHGNPFSDVRKRGPDDPRQGAVPRVSAPAYRSRAFSFRYPPSTSTPSFRSRVPATRAFSSIASRAPYEGGSSGLSLRTYSTKTETRKNGLRQRFAPETKIDLARIMDDFRDLELLELLKGVNPKSAVGFKDAHRALYPLYHRIDQGEIKHATFGDLDSALPELFSAPWTTIEQRLVEGKVSKLSALSARERAELNLLSLHSIGPTRARNFVANGCKTPEDLIKADEKGKIKLSKAQKIGLRHREDIGRLIPREEMEKLKAALESALAKLDPAFECEILGSYRRGVGFSSDIDLAVRHASFVDKDDEETSKPMVESIVRQLEKDGLIEKENQLMLGPKKYAGLMRLPKHRHYRRIDVRLSPYPSYPYMLLGTTGDALLMKLLRHTAKRRGLCLNEIGMGEKYDAADENPNGFRPGTLKIVESEQEIFELLGFPYLKPEEREFSVWKGIFERAGIKGLDQLHRL
ncbi:hypothetical protein JCM10212_000738 [Sporobolomyces blumeae]